MRINPYLFGILVLVIFLGTIWGFQAAGIWSISGKLTGSGKAVQPAADNVDTIKGWMTLEQIVNTYNVSLADILAQFSLPADTPISTAVKDLESDTFSVTELRAWLQSRMEPTQPTTTPIPAQQETHTPAGTPDEPQSTLLPSEHIEPDKKVTGKTTFQEILDWGVPEETMREIIGGELPALSTIVKDYATQTGMAFSEIKDALQAEADKIK